MRIPTTIEKKGLFWQENDIEYKIPGILKISDGGIIHLDLFYPLARNQEEHFKYIKHNKIPILYGEIEEDKFITLLNCNYYSPIKWDKLSRSEVKAQFAFIGNTLINEETKFERCIFSTEYLFEWVSISGIEIDTSGLFETEEQYLKIEYFVPNDIEYNLANELKIRLIFTGNIPIKNNSNEFKILQNVYISIEKNNKNKEFFIDIIYKITNFLNFALNSNINLNTVKFYSNINDYTEQFDVYYQSMPFFVNTRYSSINNILIPYNIIMKRFEEIIDKWVEAYSVFGPALALYFYARGENNLYIDGRFLSIVQAIETYSNRADIIDINNIDNAKNKIKEKLLKQCPKNYKDWLKSLFEYDEGISLRKRLDAIANNFINFFHSKTQIKSFINKIIVARNYLTHYNSALEEEYNRINIYQLYSKTNVLFMLIILKYIGFSQEEIKKLLNNNEQLKSMLNFISDND